MTQYTPMVRTNRDALVQIVLDAWWAGDNAPLVSDEYTEMMASLPSVHDWIDATSPALVGMDWPTVLRASRAWHRQFQRGALGAGAPAPGLVILRWPDGWTLQRLLTKADLAAEGTAMQHCVGGPDRGGGRRDGESSYWQEMRDGHISILSLRDPTGKPEATIEVSRRREPYQAGVEQIQGPMDEAPNEAAQAHLVEAAFKLGWWDDPDSDRRLPRLGRAPVFSDAYLEERGGPPRRRTKLSLDADPDSAYSLRVLTDLANKVPDEFDASRKERLLAATYDVLKSIFERKGVRPTASKRFISPRNARGEAESGAVLGVLVDTESSKTLTILWGQPGGLRWIVQPGLGLTEEGQVFTRPYDALRALTNTVEAIPTEALAAIEVLPGLPAQARYSVLWKVEVDAKDPARLRAQPGRFALWAIDLDAKEAARLRAEQAEARTQR